MTGAVVVLVPSVFDVAAAENEAASSVVALGMDGSFHDARWVDWVDNIDTGGALSSDGRLVQPAWPCTKVALGGDMPVLLCCGSGDDDQDSGNGCNEAVMVDKLGRGDVMVGKCCNMGLFDIRPSNGKEPIVIADRMLAPAAMMVAASLLASVSGSAVSAFDAVTSGTAMC